MCGSAIPSKISFTGFWWSALGHFPVKTILQICCTFGLNNTQCDLLPFLTQNMKIQALSINNVYFSPLSKHSSFSLVTALVSSCPYSIKLLCRDLFNVSSCENTDTHTSRHMHSLPQYTHTATCTPLHTHTHIHWIPIICKEPPHLAATQERYMIKGI